MASAGTLLSDLESKSPVFNKDDDLVNKILADMNIPSSSNPVMNQPQALPPPSGTGRVINAPNPNSTYPVAIDPGTATAHMIGKDYPTAADFANLMHSASLSHGGSSFAPLQQQQPRPTCILILSHRPSNQFWLPLLFFLLVYPLLMYLLAIISRHYYVLEVI